MSLPKRRRCGARLFLWLVQLTGFGSFLGSARAFQSSRGRRLLRRQQVATCESSPHPKSAADCGVSVAPPSSAPIDTLLNDEQWTRLTTSYTRKRDRELLDKSVEFLQKQRQHDVSVDHALGRSSIIADMKLDVATLVTSLVYDHAVVTNDKPQQSTNAGVSLKEMKEMFGTEICSLVKGLHQISGIMQYDHASSSDRQAEYYRRLVLATARDIRVLLVKLADQTQRIRTLDSELDQQKQLDIARETLDVYAPLAHRLGMYSIKTEMEDTALRFWKPATYQKLQTLVAARQEQRQIYTQAVIETLQRRMESTGLNSAKITGRAKSFYSTFCKMQSQNLKFHDIQDLMAFRIAVDDVAQCYQALGVVQAHWEPVPGRFKDYIVQPKMNGYQSLHTTVVGPEGRHIEVQIRTHQMHEVAEGGVAAHWIYKGQNTKNAKQAERFAELRQLVEGIQMMNDEPKRESSNDLFENEVFIFSPEGQLFALTKGATILDFAYRIHSKLGDHCVGAKVDGRMVPLRYQVENGETVEVLQSSTQTPHQEWLNVVKTSKAKQRIKSWLRKQRLGDEDVSTGRDFLEKELRRYTSKGNYPTDGMPEYREKLDDLLSVFKLQDEDHLFRSLAFGQISVSNVIKEVFRSPRQMKHGDQLYDNGREVPVNSVKGTVVLQPVHSDGLVVGGKRNMMVIFCGNCNALYGEEVKGVVTRGRGVKVHRMDCKYLLESEMERRVDAVWDESAKSVTRPAKVEVIFEDKPDMLANMSKAISLAKVRIGGVVMKQISDGRGLARFELMLSSIDDLAKITIQLQRERGVLSVTRK